MTDSISRLYQAALACRHDDPSTSRTARLLRSCRSQMTKKLAAEAAVRPGCNVGSTIAYYVAAYGVRPVLERWGEYILISPAEIKRADDFFIRYGSATVFFGRLLPVVR